MTTGYQRPRTNKQHNRSGAGANAFPGAQALLSDALIDLAETELAELFDLPGGEVAAEELELEILAQQADEFTCGSCFLVRHRSQLALEKNGLMYCKDCQG